MLKIRFYHKNGVAKTRDDVLFLMNDTDYVFDFEQLTKIIFFFWRKIWKILDLQTYTDRALVFITKKSTAPIVDSGSHQGSFSQRFRFCFFNIFYSYDVFTWMICLQLTVSLVSPGLYSYGHRFFGSSGLRFFVPSFLVSSGLSSSNVGDWFMTGCLPSIRLVRWSIMLHSRRQADVSRHARFSIPVGAR